MSEKKIGELALDIKTNVADVVKKFKELKKNTVDGAKKSAKEWKENSKALKAVKRGADVARKAIKKIAPVARAAGKAIKAMSVGIGAIIAAGGALVAFVGELAGQNDAMSKLAATTGMTAEEFERLAFAAGQSGVDAETLSGSIRDLNKNLAEGLKTGTGPAAEALNDLGLSFSDLQGTATDQLGILADSLNQVQDPMQRMILSGKILGEEGGPRLASLLAEGSEGIKKLASEANVQTDEQRRALTSFADMMGELKNTFQGLLRDVIVPLLPAITTVAEGFADIFSKMADTGVIEQLTEVLNVLVGIVFELIEELMPLYEELANSGALEAIVETIKLLGAILLDIIRFLMPALRLTITLIKPILDVINIILTVVQKLTKEIERLSKKFLEWLKSLPFVEKLMNGIQGLGKAVDFFARRMRRARKDADELSLSFEDALANAEKLAAATKKDNQEEITNQELENIATAQGFGQGVVIPDAGGTPNQKRINELYQKGTKDKKEKGKTGGLTEAESNELRLLLDREGKDTGLADDLLAKKGGRGGGKGKKDPTSDVTLTQALTAFRGGRGSASDLAQVAKGLSAKTPKAESIKPTVAITFYNMENKFNIKSSGDPKVIASEVEKSIEKVLKRKNARAGDALSSTVVS